MPRRRGPLEVTLDTLLREGCWGPIRLGVARQFLVSRLGQPDGWIASDTEHTLRGRGQPIAGWALSEQLVFGGIEFHFPPDPAGRCTQIFCDDLDALGSGSGLRVSAGWLREGLSLARVCAQLDAAGLTHEQRPFPTAPHQIRLVLASGVRLGLVDDPSFFETPGQGMRLFCVVC